MGRQPRSTSIALVELYAWRNFVNNQRAFPRFPITLDVSVILPGKGSLKCQVRDYCPGGMFLLCDEVPVTSAKGSELVVEFSVPESAGESYRMQGRVARSMTHGMGVAFTAPNQVALMALAQLSERQSAQQKQAGAGVSGDVGLIAAGCREVGVQGLRRLVARFFAVANDSMYDAAGYLGDGMEQATFVAAMNDLSRAKERLANGIVTELEQRFDVLDQAGYAPPSGLSDVAEPGGLSLVDEQKFDNWLVIRSLASKVEEAMKESLEALETRFAAISPNRLDKESNPVGPLVVATVFSEALDELALDDMAKKAIFLVMESVLSGELKQLYSELNTRLIEQGVLPELKQGMELIKAPGADQSQQYPEEEEPADEVTPAQRQGASHASSAASPKATGQAATGVSYRRVSAQGDDAANPPAPAVPYQGVQELMHLQGSGADAVPAAPNGYFSSGEVMQALSHLEGAVAEAERAKIEADGHVQFLVDTLSRLTGEDGKGLSDEDRDTVAYVGGLFSSMHQDRHLPPVVKPWLDAMEVPLLKAGIADPTLVEDAEHPARQVVNRLEQVGRYLDSDKGESREETSRQIDELLEAVKQRVEQDPDVFAEVLGKLDGVRDVYRGVYRNNIRKIVEECEQESALNRQREAVLAHLNEILGKREVPSVIISLLESGLKNLLFRTLVKGGADSDAYRFYLSFIDQLSARLAGRAPVKSRKQVDDKALRQWLSRVLANAVRDEAQRDRLFAEIDGYLAGKAQPKMQFVPHLAVKSSHLDEVHSRPADLDTDAWQLLLNDARAIDDGESFVYEDKEKGQQEVTLVWRDEEDSPPRYVFANNSGEKSLDLSLGEVAGLLYHSVLARMEMRDLSATERATYDFLQNIHNNLSFQAQHDELTGLLNRKAFERGLETTYSDAIASKRGGVLGYIDLDRFNIVNTTCGHAEGDKLLQQVAEIFKENAGDGASVARLGGDEFGIILEGTSRVEGLKRITMLHDAIRDVRFCCEDNEFKVTASVGMAEINENSESSGRLLSAVDAACFTAKDQGRDNIQIHNPENSRISNRNNILEWVGRINVLFDKNLIQLRCQKIDPLQKTVNCLPHYEVLLDVQDEQGNKVPTQDFIVAAERYNRITDIDTWVVDYLFQWLEKHRDKLARLNGISINLSGNSIGNRRFMEHIQQRMSVKGFPVDKVIFEVTETVAINNLDNAARFMRMLKDVGCRFSLDDFGSGTSSYSYLRSLPIDYLKIDGAFVTDIARNPNDYAVVKSINEIGHVMGLKTVAEYVEDEFSLQALKTIGLDYVQGFGVEKPIPLQKLFG